MINLHAIYSGILVNLLAKLTRTSPNGGHGGGSPLPVPVAGWVRGMHSGEARTQQYQRIPWSGMDSKTIANETIMRTIARNVAGTRSITRNITRCTGIC